MSAQMMPTAFYPLGQKGIPYPVPGAIARYDCDDGSGQVLTDYSGNGNHGTLGSTAGVDTNDPQWNEKGLVLGGDDSVSIPQSPSFEFGSGDFAIEVIVKPTVVDGNYHVVLAAFTAEGGGLYPYIRIKNTNEWQFGILETSIVDTVPVVPENWYHLAAVRSGSEYRGYVNGRLVDVRNIGAADVGTNPVGYRIGRLGDYPYAPSYFEGGIAGIRIMKGIALNPLQIAQNYTYDKARLALKEVILQ